MVTDGNTPLELYRLVAAKRPSVSHLNMFALDEYVGVPLDEPRNCANFVQRTVVEPWGISPANYFTISSLEENALESVRAHERLIVESGGLDVVILGLGQNGHLAFNEPGSTEDSVGRVLDLEPISIEANRQWFGGAYAPVKGATVGMKTLLSARHVLLMAYGDHKTNAVREMVEGKRGLHCPASFLQGHPGVEVFLDRPAAAALREQIITS
jgi:glucosamine-6-phosphate deaminase